MTHEQQRNMLEYAAKACGLPLQPQPGLSGIYRSDITDSFNRPTEWNPLANGLDTAEMCAKLEIGTEWVGIAVRCFCGNVEIDAHFKDHDNSRLKAWMYAATMVAAKIGGMK